MKFYKEVTELKVETSESGSTVGDSETEQTAKTTKKQSQKKQKQSDDNEGLPGVKIRTVYNIDEPAEKEDATDTVKDVEDELPKKESKKKLKQKNVEQKLEVESEPVVEVKSKTSQISEDEDMDASLSERLYDLTRVMRQRRRAVQYVAESQESMDSYNSDENVKDESDKGSDKPVVDESETNDGRQPTIEENAVICPEVKMELNHASSKSQDVINDTTEDRNKSVVDVSEPNNGSQLTIEENAMVSPMVKIEIHHGNRKSQDVMDDSSEDRNKFVVNDSKTNDGSQPSVEENAVVCPEVKIEIHHSSSKSHDVINDSAEDRNINAAREQSRPLREDYTLWVPRGRIELAEENMDHTKDVKVSDKTDGRRKRKCAACDIDNEKETSDWIECKAHRDTLQKDMIDGVKEEKIEHKRDSIRKRYCTACSLQYEMEQSVGLQNDKQQTSDYYIVMRTYDGQLIKYKGEDFKDRNLKPEPEPEAENVYERKRRCAACDHENVNFVKNKYEKVKKFREGLLDINKKLDQLQSKTDSMIKRRCTACGKQDDEARLLREDENHLMREVMTKTSKAGENHLEAGENDLEAGTNDLKEQEQTKDKTDSIRKRNCSACGAQREQHDETVRKQFIVLLC